MMNAGRSQPRAMAAVRSEINVTPLVDVCLVLLIIFMVVTPMLSRRIQVALPETANAPRMPEASRQLTVAVTSDKGVFVDQAWVPQDRLTATLRALHDRSPDRAVVVHGDRRLHYQTVVSVLDMLRAAGFERVGLATERRTAR
jgi:biopolymer transport protein ExbD